jgi:hypothetical protein
MRHQRESCFQLKHCSGGTEDSCTNERLQLNIRCGSKFVVRLGKLIKVCNVLLMSQDVNSGLEKSLLKLQLEATSCTVIICVWKVHTLSVKNITQPLGKPLVVMSGSKFWLCICAGLVQNRPSYRQWFSYEKHMEYASTKYFL